MTMPATEVLRAEGVHRRFPGVHALKGVDLRLLRGEIHALMGQNGAGKSTLIKVLTGVYPAEQGQVLLDGHPFRPRSPQESRGSGISTVYQEVNLCPNLSVGENVFAGRYPRHGFRGGWRIDWRRVADGTRALLARLNLDIDVERRLGEYPLAVRQMVAIARALAIESRVLILDEPTSSLDDEEVARLFTVLRQMRGEGLAILFVTHFLDQVYDLCDRITVLRNGELVGEYTVQQLPAPALVAAMVGREVEQAAGAERAPGPADAATAAGRAAAAGGGSDATVTGAGPAAPALEARGLGRRGQVRPTDLSLRSGQVLGLAGLLGSGRTELARLLFGLDRADQGTLLRGGRVVVLQSPLDAIRLGIAFCPEDRKGEGIIADLDVTDNIILALQSRQGLARRLGRRDCERIARQYVDALGIRVADLRTPIAQLSGGNQQKALLARWLATDPDILILDEPTRGIDVVSRQEILAGIRRLAAQGKAVLFISSEIEEVVQVADAIAVLRDRRKVADLGAVSDEQSVYRVIAAGSA